MTPHETLLLTRYVKACCPQQHIDEYTPDAWHDLLADLDSADCQAAVAAIVKRQPFIAVADIRSEVKRIRSDRLAREIPAAPPPEIADDPGRYKAALDAEIRKIADGRSVHRAIGGPVREDDPPEEWAEARAKLAAARETAAKLLTPEEIALQQAAESRAARGARVADEPDDAEPAA